MKLTEILKILESIAPVSLSDEFCKRYGFYDNSGIIIDSGNEVNGALFSLDLSVKAVEQAKLRGFNLIVTHHPAIYGGISRIDVKGDPLSAAIAECIKCGISVISMHLNFDAAPKGIDYFLMKGIGGENAEIHCDLSGGGYGRVYNIEPVLFSQLVQNIKKTFSTERLFAYGSDRQVNKVASFCGAGCDDKTMAFAVSKGVDVFVSSDMKHHEITALTGRGINVIQMTHYASETYGFGKIYSEISAELPFASAYFCDAELM